MVAQLARLICLRSSRALVRTGLRISIIVVGLMVVVASAHACPSSRFETGALNRNLAAAITAAAGPTISNVAQASCAGSQEQGPSCSVSLGCCPTCISGLASFGAVLATADRPRPDPLAADEWLDATKPSPNFRPPRALT